jgi:hypothetical protein
MAEMRMRKFVLCPSPQFRTFKEGVIPTATEYTITFYRNVALQLHFRTTAIVIFFLSSPQLVNEMLRRNCISALPHSIAEMQTQKGRGLRLRTFKFGLPYFCNS